MGVSVEEMVAVGDSETDVRLLETAGYGIALANAHESLKAVADRVTTMRGGDGFAEATRIVLSERGRKTAYIAGPIQGMEENQSYRETLRRILTANGYEVSDPWERERTVYSSTGPAWWKNVPVEGFIRRDLENIEKCDLFVAYLPRLSAGSCMELFYAKNKGKRTMVICQMERPSPWIVAHSDLLFKNVDEFKGALKKFPESRLVKTTSNRS
jgi:nucleoside 2-deoxyribosyltransferase